MTEEIRQIPVHLVQPSPYQPRRRFEEEALEELAASIRQHGFIQPLVVRPVGSRFELIAGERRFRAARKLGLEEVPAIVRHYEDERALEAALIENLQREEITVVEAARAYQRLADEFHYSHSEIARQTGKSRTSVTNSIRLLQLPPPVLEMLDRGDLTEGHARALLTLPYPSLQSELGEWIVRNAVPVREAERKARALLKSPEGGGKTPEKKAATDAHIAALEDRLRRHFGTRAAIAYRNGAGSVTLEFYDDEDLGRILELMGLEE